MRGGFSAESLRRYLLLSIQSVYKSAYPTCSPDFVFSLIPHISTVLLRRQSPDYSIQTHQNQVLTAFTMRLTLYVSALLATMAVAAPGSAPNDLKIRQGEPPNEPFCCTCPGPNCNEQCCYAGASFNVACALEPSCCPTWTDDTGTTVSHTRPL